MNKYGHWDIMALGNWEKYQLTFRCILICLLFQFPNVLQSEIPPVSLDADRQFTTGQFDSALISYRLFIQQFPEQKEGYFNRGLCLYKLGKYSEAILDFDQCLRIDSSFSEGHLLRGLSLEKRGDWKDALTEYEGLSSQDTYSALLERRIKIYRISVILSKNWYYMIAMMLLVILLMAVGVKSVSYKRGW